MNPAEADEDGEVRLSIVKPKKQKTPVAVGAEAGAEDLAEDEGHSDGDVPEIGEPGEQ